MFSDWGFSWAGWLDNRRGEWWLAAQLILIAANLLPVWPVPAVWGLTSWPRLLFGAGLLLLGLGLLRAVQALKALGSSLSPLPAAKPAAALVRSGIYSHCRHPLYRAVLLCALGVVVATGSLLHLVLLISLALVLRAKAKFEECSLLQAHPDYAAYAAQTPAIIAWCPGLDWRSPVGGSAQAAMVRWESSEE